MTDRMTQRLLQETVIPRLHHLSAFINTSFSLPCIDDQEREKVAKEVFYAHSKEHQQCCAYYPWTSSLKYVGLEGHLFKRVNPANSQDKAESSREADSKAGIEVEVVEVSNQDFVDTRLWHFQNVSYRC